MFEIYEDCEECADRVTCGQHQWCRECRHGIYAELLAGEDPDEREAYRKEMFAYYDGWAGGA